MTCKTFSPNCSLMEIFMLINDINNVMRQFSYVYYITAGSIIGINLSLMFAYYRMRKNNRIKIPNFMLFSNSFVDLFVGLSCLCSVLTNRGFKKVHEVGILEYASHFVTKYIWFLAVGNLLLFTAERYIAIKKPLFYRSSITKMKVAIATLVVWIISVVPAVVSTSLFKDTFEKSPGSHNPLQGKQRKSDFEICTKISAVIIMLGIFLIFLLVILTYREIKISTRIRITLLERNPVQPNGHKSKPTKVIDRELKKEKRILLTFFLMSVAYTISFLPSAVLLMIDLRELSQIGASLIDIVIMQMTIPLLHVCSGLINPLLIILMNIDYRCIILSFIKSLCICLPSRRATPRVPRRWPTTTTEHLTTTAF